MKDYKLEDFSCTVAKTFVVADRYNLRILRKNMKQFGFQCKEFRVPRKGDYFVSVRNCMPVSTPYGRPSNTEFYHEKDSLPLPVLILSGKE
jgi:hypothetical protein